MERDANASAQAVIQKESLSRINEAHVWWSSNSCYAGDIGDGTTRRHKDNIEKWLANWDSVCQLAQRSIAWSDVKLDIQIAVSNMRLYLRELFELYCVAGYEQPDVCYIMEWSVDTFRRSYDLMISLLCKRLNDRTIRSIAVQSTGIIYPTGWAGGKIDWYDRS